MHGESDVARLGAQDVDSNPLHSSFVPKRIRVWFAIP
jgi:hypothetical protein